MKKIRVFLFAFILVASAGCRSAWERRSISAKEMPSLAQTASTNSLKISAATPESWDSISNRWGPASIEVIKKAGEHGDSSAQYFLAILFADGLRGETDQGEAYKWMKLAAESGRPAAQRKLGWMLQTGLGVEVDMTAASGWYRKAADAGDAQAQINLGFTYTTGELDARDYPTAEKWIRRAAEQGTPEAQYAFGYLLQNEVNKAGTPDPNFPAAAEWLTKAADQGYVKAQYELASLYFYGHLGEEQRSNCIPWFIKAAANGDAEAQAKMGELEVYFPKSDLIKSFHPVDNLKRSASQGNLEAELQLAERYRIGDGVEKDLVQAFKWMENAAQHDMSRSSLAIDANYRLGRMYEKGEGVAADATKASELYRAASESQFLNIPEPELRLGEMYEKGQGVAQDDVSAVACYWAAVHFGPTSIEVVKVWPNDGDKDRPFNLTVVTNYSGSIAAERLFNLYLQGRGLPEDKFEIAAQFSKLKNSVKTVRWLFLVGEVYYQGKLVKQDVAQSAIWFNQAAEKGSGDAMYRIGEMWASGANGTPDPKKAADWYRKAALAGSALGQLSWGRAYAKGDGVEQNLIEAWAWSHLAAVQNLGAARQETEQLGAKLSSKDLAAAKSRAFELSERITPNETKSPD